MTTKAKISSWDFFKTEKLLQNEKATCETGENTCKPSMIDKGLISKHEEFIQLNSKKPNNPIEKNEWRTQIDISLSEINQTEKDKYYMISLMCEI